MTMRIKNYTYSRSCSLRRVREVPPHILEQTRHRSGATSGGVEKKRQGVI